MNMISFHTHSDLLGVIPEPKPATHFFPDWYKKLPKSLGKMRSNNQTVKACVPFRDAISMGYVIPMWADCVIETKGDSIEYHWNDLYHRDILSKHSHEQVKGCPFAEKQDYSSLPLKFNNPWIIKTAPGYSCLFTCMNFLNDGILNMFSGVVETDTYYNHINFPFTMNKEGEFLIKKGEPIIQVIPFKRSELKMEVEIETIDDNEVKKTLNRLGSHLNDGYKEEYWIKK